MQPWQERVVTEEKELRVKLGALRKFIATGNPEYARLPFLDRDLLIRQRDAMELYLAILVQRIARFATATS